MIVVGERCKECSKIHLIRSISELDSLSPSLRAKIYKTSHRIFDSGYYASLDKDSEVWEFYLPLSVFKLERIQEEQEESEKDLTEEYLKYLYEVCDEEDL
jgi:hypothetical protein